MKTYNRTQIGNIYNKQTKDRKIAILYDALDYMQSYNGRSKLDCIILAMGYDSNDYGETFFKERK